MSTPKIKVYRIPETGYSQETDSDIQSVVSEELLPVVEKSVDSLSAEPLVGVKLRGDARLVKESEIKSTFIAMDRSSVQSVVDSSDASKSVISGTMKTVSTRCDGWVVGRGNFELYVRKILSSNDGYSKSTSYSDSGWEKIDEKFWDYSLERRKTYVTSSGDYKEALSSGDSVASIVNSEYIVFSIGDMLVKSNSFFNDSGKSYSNGDYVRIVTPSDDETTKSENQILIKYREFSELDDQDLSNSITMTNLRTPFGDIYNGNKSGRKVSYASGKIDWTSCNYFEGNYIYKKKISPLRVKVIGSNTDFNTDVAISNGSFDVIAGKDWYFEGEFAPVLMERITVDGRKIFSELENGTQYNKTVSDVSGNDAPSGSKKIRYSFIEKYYLDENNAVHYPTELFLFYNVHGDSTCGIFDFNYNYSNSSFTDDYLCSGNNGKVSSVKSGYSFGNGKYCMTDEKIAVRNGFGYNGSLGHIELKCSSEGKIWFAIPSSISFDKSQKMKIYSGLNEICECECSLFNESYKYVVIEKSGDAYSSILVNSEPDSSGTEFLLNEVMVSYCKTISMGGTKNSNVNPDCIGYRVPCYEKVKSSNLFVSSYPGWVRGHLNNDLDVFVGNSEYSGTTQTDVSANGIYPKYVEDGWYGMYSEGAVQFNEEQTTMNYYDIYNHYVASNSTLEVNWSDVVSRIKPHYMLNPPVYVQLLYCDVKANVARYDSVYVVQRARMSNYSVADDMFHYALINDDDFSEAFGKKWSLRNDGNVRRLYESGEEVFPIVRNSENGSLESSTVMTSHQIEDSGKYLQVNFTTNRMTSVMMKRSSDGNHDGIHIIMNSSANETKEVESGVSSYDTIHFKIEENTLKCGIVSGGSVQTWYSLEDFDDEYDGSFDLSGSQYGTIEGSDSFARSNGILHRCRYYNSSWYYDVYFEVMCYHYDNSGNVSNVEIAIYKVNKDK